MLVSVLGLCVAVDVLDAHGVWWWEPGAAGCASRSTGPTVFHADQANVSRQTSGAPVSVNFRLGTHSTTRPFIDVQLIVESGTMRVVESGAKASLRERTDLDVPENCCRP